MSTNYRLIQQIHRNILQRHHHVNFRMVVTVGQTIELIMSTERNPSPPPEDEEDDNVVGEDHIGSTAYSKRFVLQALLNLVKEAQVDDGIEDSGPAELEETVDADLCQLWDMTADKEVSRFVADAESLSDIFLSVIRATNKPRLTELLAGILANLMCDEECLQKLTPLPQIRECAFLLFNCRDLPTLVETSRLLSLISRSSFWTAEWETSFDDFGAYDDVIFVLSSSTSSELLLQAAKLIFNLTQVKESRMSEKAVDNLSDFVGCVCDALTQCFNDQSFQAAAYLLMSLSVLSDHKRCTFPESDSSIDRLFKCIESAIDGVLNVEALEWTSDHLLLIESSYATMNDFIDQFASSVHNGKFLDKTKTVVLSIESVLEGANDDQELKERCCECLTRIRAILLTFPADVDASSVIDIIAAHIS